MSVPAEPYPWYVEVDNSCDLLQGDLIESYERVWEYDNETEEVIFNKYNFVVMTQSCDIQKSSFSHLTLCPIFTFDELAREWPDIRIPKNKEEVRRGNVIGFHLLNKCQLPGLKRDFQIVNFKRIFQAPKNELIDFISDKRRIRLQPPYREHLAQAFARFFMRVGLPTDIPAFK